MQRITFSRLIIVLLLLGCTALEGQARRIVAPRMYMFGMAASFNDTIVCFTDIQRVDSAWIDKKTGFLQSRDIYSGQLRTFLSETKQLPNRTCVVFYDNSREKLEKTFVKIRRLYSKGKDGLEHFDLRMLEPGEFRFQPIDLTGLDEAELEQAIEYEQAEQAAQKAKKKKKQ